MVINMYGAMIHYYFFNDLVSKLDSNILQKMDYDDNLIFNIANFNTSPSFYKIFNLFKGDKYKIQNKFDNNEYNSFIVDCIINLQKENDYKKLLFLYGMVSHRILNNYIYPYIYTLKSDEYSFNRALNMLDFYLSKWNSFDVTKESIYKKFSEAFTYYDYMDELIRNPMVKDFKLMSSQEYFKKCYKNKKKFYKKFAKVKYKSIYLSLVALLYHKNGLSPKEFPYKDRIDTRLLNKKKEFFKIGDKEYNDTFEEMIQKAQKEALNTISAINSYLFSNNDVKIRKIYNIPETKKL